MKALKKAVNVVLSLVIVFSVFTIVPFTASAEDTVKLVFNGGGTLTAYMANITVATLLGEVVAETTATYTDGALTGLSTGGTNWGDGWGNMQYVSFVEESFGGSLPKFLAAFMGKKKLSEEQIAEIQKMIEDYE